MRHNKVVTLIKHTEMINISVHLFQSHRPGMGEEELQDETIIKLIAERKSRQVW